MPVWGDDDAGVADEQDPRRDVAGSEASYTGFVRDHCLVSKVRTDSWQVLGKRNASRALFTAARQPVQALWMCRP
jgi:hypothetical protein